MTDPMDSTLGHLRLDGALFFRSELSDVSMVPGSKFTPPAR